jgi:hypothetical protein
LALDILDQRKLKKVVVGDLANDRRDANQACQLRRPPPSLASYKFEQSSARPHQQWLDDATRPNGLG